VGALKLTSAVPITPPPPRRGALEGRDKCFVGSGRNVPFCLYEFPLSRAKSLQYLYRTALLVQRKAYNIYRVLTLNHIHAVRYHKAKAKAKLKPIITSVAFTTESYCARQLGGEHLAVTSMYYGTQAQRLFMVFLFCCSCINTPGSDVHLRKRGPWLGRGTDGS
jgi:hypothetical protein